jgi:hypothetical protein
MANYAGGIIIENLMTNRYQQQHFYSNILATLNEACKAMSYNQ